MRDVLKAKGAKLLARIADDVAESLVYTRPVPVQPRLRHADRSLLEGGPEPSLRLPQRLPRLPVRGDVARDSDQSSDVSVLVAQGNFGGGHPGHPAIRPGFLFLQADDRRPGIHHPLLILVSLAGVLPGEIVGIGPADGLAGIAQSEPLRHVVIDANEAAVAVLEIDVVRDRA